MKMLPCLLQSLEASICLALTGLPGFPTERTCTERESLLFNRRLSIQQSRLEDQVNII